MENGKQKILITGASSGLGRELAHQYAKKHWKKLLKNVKVLRM